LKPIPASPENIIPNNDLPTFTPVPIPNQVPTVTPSAAPTEPERPVRKRRRRPVVDRTSPQVRRDRTDSTEDTTPRTRRNRRITTNDEEAAPTPRKRRNRPTTSEIQPQPIPVAKPDLGDNGIITTPPKEEQVPIVVPEAKKSAPPAKTDAPPSSGDIDTN
jgi:hypothetical protein